MAASTTNTRQSLRPVRRSPSRSPSLRDPAPDMRPHNNDLRDLATAYGDEVQAAAQLRAHAVQSFGQILCFG